MRVTDEQAHALARMPGRMGDVASDLLDARRERDEARAALQVAPSPQRIAEAVQIDAIRRSQRACGEAGCGCAGAIAAMDLSAIIAAVKQ